jgi:hypothetical protein
MIATDSKRDTKRSSRSLELPAEQMAGPEWLEQARPSKSHAVKEGKLIVEAAAKRRFGIDTVRGGRVILSRRPVARHLEQLSAKQHAETTGKIRAISPPLSFCIRFLRKTVTTMHPNNTQPEPLSTHHITERRPTPMVLPTLFAHLAEADLPPPQEAGWLSIGAVCLAAAVSSLPLMC